MPEVTPSSSSPSPLRFGTAPVNWNNFDLEGWRPVVPFPAILDAMVTAGYERTEWDASFGADPAELLAASRPRGLEFVAAYRWVDFVNDDQFSLDLVELRRFMPTLQAIGVTDLIVADALRPDRVAHAGAIPADGSLSLSASAYRTLADNLVRLADVASGFDLHLRYHNHVGSYIETPQEVDDLLAVLDPARVNLCFDTGHFAFGGGDPYRFIAEHLDAIGLLHLKDVDGQVLDEARRRHWSFQDALRHIIFCPLGEGTARIADVVDVLVDNEFEGHVIIEQDTCARDSTETAKRNLERARSFEHAARQRRSTS